MRVIDERGVLFKKINVIDFLVVLFLFSLGPMFYFGYKIVTKKHEVIAPEKEFIETEMDYRFIKVKPELAKIISVDDKELNENGQVIGEIISLDQSEPYKYEFDIGEEQKIIKQDPVLRQIEARLKLTAEIKQGKPYYKDREIRIGSPLEFKTEKYTLTIIPLKEKEFVETEMDYRFIKVKPELAKIISVDDKELNENGQVIGEIISLDQSEPYKYEFDIGEEQKIIKQDPVLRQIEARLKLKAEVKQGKPYYKDKEIRIDSPLEFKSNNYILTAIPFEKEEERMIDLHVILKDLDEDTIKKISVGDKEVDESGETIAEILSLGKIENSSIEFDLGGGSLVIGRDSTKKQISTRMRLRCQVRGGSQLYFKDKKVAQNTPLEFKTDKYEVIGLSAEDYKPYHREKWISLQVKFSRVVPEIAEVVKKGDIEKDAFGKKIARISSIISNEPALVTTVYEDKFLTLRHPFDRDIVASLEVLCVEKEGAYHFKDNLAKMGNDIKFITDLYSISGLIIGISVK